MGRSTAARSLPRSTLTPNDKMCPIQKKLESQHTMKNTHHQWTLVSIVPARMKQLERSALSVANLWNLAVSEIVQLDLAEGTVISQSPGIDILMKVAVPRVLEPLRKWSMRVRGEGVSVSMCVCVCENLNRGRDDSGNNYGDFNLERGWCCKCFECHWQFIVIARRATFDDDLNWFCDRRFVDSCALHSTQEVRLRMFVIFLFAFFGITFCVCYILFFLSPQIKKMSSNIYLKKSFAWGDFKIRTENLIFFWNLL